MYREPYRSSVSPFSLHEAAAHAMCRRLYREAERLFRAAAMVAYTREGRIVLLEKADEARTAQQQQGSTV